MSATPPQAGRTGGAAVLLRWRIVQLRNAADQQLREAPLRTLAVLGMLVLIWVVLYHLLVTVLRHVRNWGMVGLLADQQVFVHFFLVLGVMLAFSGAILMYGTLFGRREPAALLATPVPAGSVVAVKWLEGLILSSWSFVLLGVPLMLAVGRTTPVAGYYYPLFLAHFVGFVAIPASLGLLAAWAVAMYAPRRPLRVALISGALLVAALGAWVYRAQQRAGGSDPWLRSLLAQLSAANQPLLPSTWTARGVVAAIDGQPGTSLFYLSVVLADGAFLAWCAINLVARSWPEAFSRAQLGRAQPVIRHGWLTALLCRVLFFYLPARLRAVMLKDLRAFARDPRQWVQMVIMFGLLLVYVVNLTRFPLDFPHPQMHAVIAVLNLLTVSLILATFTSRFLFPLLSLESGQLWLLETLPLRRHSLLLVKFVFALTVTAVSGGLVMGLAVRALELPAVWARMHLAVCLTVCVGLSGLAIGLGARFPVLGQRNPARIAAGLGGTFNLIASMLFVVVQIAGVAFVTATEARNAQGLPARLAPDSLELVAGLVALGLVVAGGALLSGARHFARLEV